MSRQALTDGTGKWFSPDAAERTEERTTWNGNNWISDVTGSQWEHECLYRTKGGKFILKHWSDYQGTRTTYEELGKYDAAVWYSTNGDDPHKDCEKEFNELEIK